MRNPWELLEGASLRVELWLQDWPSKLITVAFTRVRHTCTIPVAWSHSGYGWVFLAVLAIEKELRPVHSLGCSHFLVWLDGDVWHTCHISGVASFEWHLLTFYAHERSTCVLPLIIAYKFFSIRPNPHWAPHHCDIAFGNILASDVSINWMLLVILVELCMRTFISFSIRKRIYYSMLLVVFTVVIEISVKIILQFSLVSFSRWRLIFIGLSCFFTFRTEMIVLTIARGMIIVFAIFSDLIVF